MVAQLSKGIKPKKLNIDKVRQNLLNALRREGSIVKKEYEKTVATWNDPPKFEVLIGLERGASGNATTLVGPTGTELQVSKFLWTDEGTRPHVIKAKNAPNLVFQRGFTPKTQPGKIASGPGQRFGDFVKKKQVNHPGTKARRFTETIAKRRRKPFTQAMIKAAKV
jgi:hypothetical protein